MSNDNLGKKAEHKIKEWLDDPENGYCFDRIPDQMTGFYGSDNICDFTLYKYPNLFYIESKSTWNDRFDFSNITENQRVKMLEKSEIDGVDAFLMLLFASYKRAFLFRISDIQFYLNQGIKSLNIKKIHTWVVPFVEVPTIPSRKELLDYTGRFEILVSHIRKEV